MLVADFQIQFSLQRFTNNSIITPYKIVFLTNQKKIESEVKEAYSEFLYHKILSPQENLKYIEMQNFIVKRANQLSLSNQIENYFFENKWFYPLDRSQVKTKITKGNSKYWTNKDYPYLEIQGEIEIDMEKAFDLYYKNKFTEFKVDNKIINKLILLKFNKNWPLIITYQNYNSYRELLLNIIRDKFTKSRFYTLALEKATGLKNILKGDIEFRWKNNDIEVVINSTTYMLTQKIIDNKFKIIAGLYLLNKKYK